MADENNREQRRREELDATTDELRQFATPAEWRRILRKAGSPEEIEAAIDVFLAMRTARAGRRIVYRDLYFLVITTAALITALLIIQRFGGDVLTWLMPNSP